MFYVGISDPTSDELHITLHHSIFIYPDLEVAKSIVKTSLKKVAEQALDTLNLDLAFTIIGLISELDDGSDELLQQYGTQWRIVDVDGKVQYLTLSPELPDDSTYEIVEDHSNCTDEGCLIND